MRNGNVVRIADRTALAPATAGLPRTGLSPPSPRTTECGRRPPFPLGERARSRSESWPEEDSHLLFKFLISIRYRIRHPNGGPSGGPFARRRNGSSSRSTDRDACIRALRKTPCRPSHRLRLSPERLASRLALLRP